MKYIEPKKEFNIPSDIWELNSIFNDNGYKLYVVGGAIRDFLTGDTPKDFDLCTDALPSEVIDILSDKYKVQLQGESFAVVVVYTPSDPEGMEIATFRVDVSKGRNPEVKIGNVSIEEDVLRRDITINALFYDLETKRIIDLVGGIDDLENRIIRMVGDPLERIEEDPLRILRVFRFASRYGSKLDNRTQKAILLNNDITGISMERIWDNHNGEFIKSFNQAKDFQQYLDFLMEFNIMGQILPGLNVNSKIENQDDITLVLAQMLRENDMDNLKGILNKCSISSSIINQIVFLIKLLNFDKNDVLNYYKSKVRFGVNNDQISTWFSVNKIQHHNTIKFIYYKPSVSPAYVMKAYNLKPSKELGEKIKELEVINYDEL